MNRGLLPILICLCPLTSHPAYAQTPPNEVSPQTQAAAVRALDDYKNHNAELLLQDHLIEKAEDIQRATLGDPIPMCGAPLVQLAHYTSGANPKDILLCGRAFIYPVAIDGKILEGLLITKAEGDTWASADGIEGAELIKILKVLTNIAPQSRAVATYVVVLNLTFVGVPADQDMSLTSVTGDSQQGLKMGDRVSARVLFPKLVSEAQKRLLRLRPSPE